MSYPKSVLVAITCHGTVIVNETNNEPKLFRIPENMKVIKMSAVTHGVCNLTINEDVDKFIKTILDKKKKKELKEGMKNSETYAHTLANLYKSIEEDTVKDTYAASPDSNTDIRNSYIHHRDKSYKIITYNNTHPYMINKEYMRNNKTEQNSSEWDYGIFCLNVEGKPDLITKLKGRTYSNKNTSVYLEKIIDYLHKKGVEEVILFDLSCANFEYENESNKPISERNTRSIRSILNKQNLNGGRKYKYQKKRTNKFAKNNKKKRTKRKHKIIYK